MKTKSKILIILFYFFIIFFLPSFLFGQNKLTEKKLIEFGWDYPSVSSLKANIEKIEKAPFDGVCFSFDNAIYNAFDTLTFPSSKFQYNELSAINWKKFTDNFLIVRGASLSGANWLDDKSWIKISQNIAKLSKSIVNPKIKGIGFDPEYYFKDTTLNPWVYKAAYYNNLAYEQIGSYVRKRGKQFIEALQTYKPNVKILCFWLLGLVYDQNRTKPIEKTNMALYPFFIEGMLEGKNISSEIIDGNESSYSYQSFIPFITVGGYIRGKESELIAQSLRPKYKEISIAEAVYLDGLYGKHPKFEKGFDKQTKEQWLKDNLYFAFKTTDKYVWFYDERVNWWKNQVDPGVKEIITEVKNKINSEFNNRSPRLSGESSVPDFKKKEGDNYHGFSYHYAKNKKIIRIQLLKNDIKNIQLYINSLLIYSSDNPSTTFSIDLAGKNYKLGNLILISKDSKGLSSVAFVN